MAGGGLGLCSVPWQRSGVCSAWIRTAPPSKALWAVLGRARAEDDVVLRRPKMGCGAGMSRPQFCAKVQHGMQVFCSAGNLCRTMCSIE